MSQRGVRVNELLKREISDLLHTFYQEQAVYITIVDVTVSPDLRNAHIYYSVFGDAEREKAAQKFLLSNKEAIRRRVGKQIVLKYLPHFKFFHDDSLERGNRMIELLDEIADDEPEEEV